MFQFVDV